ncbi:hypothetical protein ACH40F_43150 [Streptomyces sp. NPDC020794]|uniref:hypothetical protein n=1 Tax=unclassified Streptomyces TaxID=2593676 RepID=UPI0036F0BDF5
MDPKFNPPRVTAKPGSGRLDPTAADATAKDVADRMRGLDEVRSVADPVHAANGTAVRVDITMNGPELDGKKHVDPLLALSSITAAIGLAVGVDYTLFYLKREREERARAGAGSAPLIIAALLLGEAD